MADQRAELQRALAVNAATKPVNVSVGAGVAIAGLLLGQLWLVGLAAIVYVVLSAMTFFDTGEAERVGERRRAARALPARPPLPLDPGIARHLAAAEHEEQALRVAIADSDLSFVDLLGEVDHLMEALRGVAIRAQRLLTYAREHDRTAVARRLSTAEDADLKAALEAQLQTMDRVAQRLRRFEAEMEQTVATLATMRGEVVAVGVDADELGQQRLAARVRDLRDQVRATSQAMAELSAADPGTT